MKKVIFISSIILVAFFGCKKEEEVTDSSTCNFNGFYYYQNDKYHVGDLSGEYLMIGSDTINNDDAIRELIKSNNNFDQKYGFKIFKNAGYQYKQAVIKFSKTLSCQKITEIIAEIKKNKIIDYAHYTIQTDDCMNNIWQPMGNKCINTYSSTFYVKVKDENDISTLVSMMKVTNIIKKKQNQFMADWYTLIADKNAKGDAMQMANYFHETGLFVSAEPSIIKIPVE